MLYLKRKSDGKEFPVWKYLNDCDEIPLIVVWCDGIIPKNETPEQNLGKVLLPSDEYELIFKP
jgi:hypothetical protein